MPARYIFFVNVPAKTRDYLEELDTWQTFLVFNVYLAGKCMTLGVRITRELVLSWVSSSMFLLPRCVFVLAIWRLVGYEVLRWLVTRSSDIVLVPIDLFTFWYVLPKDKITNGELICNSYSLLKWGEVTYSVGCRFLVFFIVESTAFKMKNLKICRLSFCQHFL